MQNAVVASGMNVSGRYESLKGYNCKQNGNQKPLSCFDRFFGWKMEVRGNNSSCKEFYSTSNQLGHFYKYVYLIGDNCACKRMFIPNLGSS